MRITLTCHFSPLLLLTTSLLFVASCLEAGVDTFGPAKSGSQRVTERFEESQREPERALDCVSAWVNCIRLAARKPGTRSRGRDRAKQYGANKTWGKKREMVRRLLAPELLLTACARDPSVTGNTVRICDDIGCFDRPEV
ncbi:hypothetical protein PL79_003345 [Burkholderia sp. USMB20]|nr:hypothetical protein PL79_003345 [Burkholderia sp. USMB20]